MAQHPSARTRARTLALLGGLLSAALAVAAQPWNADLTPRHHSAAAAAVSVPAALVTPAHEEAAALAATDPAARAGHDDQGEDEDDRGARRETAERTRRHAPTSHPHHANPTPHTTTVEAPPTTTPRADEVTATSTSDPARPDPDPAPSSSGTPETTLETRTSTGVPATTTSPAPVPVTGGSTGGSAAERFGWGTPVRSDDFTSGLGPGWSLYDGPGHNGAGRRSPGAVSVSGGVMTITGSPDGTTEGMAWGGGQKYGRWEARIKAPVSDPSYHAVALLWPDAENWPVGGEVDFMENSDASRQSTDMFLHYGASNSQVSSSVRLDATQWHDWAVEWTPDHVVAYVDGVEWFRSTDPRTLPPGPMHLTFQLDWFPEGGSVQTSSMSVDWVRQYAP
jgi:Glycosyl hydrolases family 16